MNLIQRYIFKRTALLSLQTLMATTVVVIITQILNYVNVMTDSGQSLLAFGKLSLLMFPAMAVVVVPFAILIGASQTLTTMNADSELAVVEASGGSQGLTAVPIVLFGLLASIATFGVTHLVEPWSNRQFRDIISNAGADLLRFAVTTGAFKKLEDKLYVQIATQLPGGAFGGIFIADMRDEKTELLYYAKKGVIVEREPNELLVMQDGEIHRKAVGSGEISVIRFASYAIDFSQFGPSGKSAVYFPKERSTAFLFNPDPDDSFSKSQPNLVRSELHRRFSAWLYPVLFALIAAYFAGSARSNRQERVWSIAAAGLVALVIRIIGFVTGNLAGAVTAYAVLTYALPAAAIVMFGWLLASGRQLRVPQRFVEGVTALATSLERMRQHLLLRLRGHSGKQLGGGA